MVTPWHRRTRNIVLLVIFVFPVGLVLLWRRSEWSVLSRSVVTAAVAVVLIASLPAAKTPTTADGSPIAITNPAATTGAATGATTDPAGAVAADPDSTTAAVVTPVQTTEPPATTDPAIVVPPAPSTCGAPPNPFGYNFCGGDHIQDPASGVCGPFHCIANFFNGKGYMVECKDGEYSMSGGIRGACSGHHGVDQPVYD